MHENIHAPVISIRLGNKEDRKSILDICRLSFRRVYTFIAAQNLKSNPHTIIAEVDGKVAGFLVSKTILLKNQKLGYIFWLATHPDYRRHGIALRLMSSIIDEFRTDGIRNVFVAVERGNKIGEDLFSKCGFYRMSRKDFRKRFGIWSAWILYSRFLLAPHEMIFYNYLK